jgi:hypothetical protein
MMKKGKSIFLLREFIIAIADFPDRRLALSLACLLEDSLHSTEKIRWIRTSSSLRRVSVCALPLDLEYGSNS